MQLNEEEKQINIEELKEYNKNIKQKGVCYLSTVASCLNVQRIRELLSDYSVERIYLEPFDKESKSSKKNRKYRQGWIEFTDKNMAKIVALSCNGQKIFNKKKGQNSDDLWSIKYLSKFQWEDLGAQQVQDNRTRKNKLMMELNKVKKQKEIYMENIEKSKSIMGMLHKKQKKAKDNDNHIDVKSKHIKKDFKQRKPLD